MRSQCVTTAVAACAVVTACAIIVLARGAEGDGCPAPAFEPPEPGVSFHDRAWDGFIDPARESNNGVDVNQGLDTLVIEFTTPMENEDGSLLSADAFTITDTAGTPPEVAEIETADGQRVTVSLTRILTLKEWTTITVNARSQCDATPFTGHMDIGFLPADLDQSGVVTPFDLLTYKQYINGITAPPLGVAFDYVDVNRSGGVNPLDNLAFKQLINGVSPPSTTTWAGESLPDEPEH